MTLAFLLHPLLYEPKKGEIVIKPNRQMTYLSILDNKTSMLCNWIVSYSQVTRLGLGLEFLVLFFHGYG